MTLRMRAVARSGRGGAPHVVGTGEAMGLITERHGAAGGYAAVTIRGALGGAGNANQTHDASEARDEVEAYGADELRTDGNLRSAADLRTGSAGEAMLHRRSALPSRRAVLYLLCQRDCAVTDDLVAWYTERGFHFYIADLRPQDQMDQPDGQGRGEPRRAERFARLDAAARQLRDDGIDMIIVSAHSSGAHTAALWCDARREADVADALILSRPTFGRRLRRGLNIACPVLVLSGGPQARGGRLAVGARRRGAGAIRLGPHVTWLRLEPPEGEEAGADAGQRRVFDELGRWLGAYMYGQVRDQLL